MFTIIAAVFWAQLFSDDFDLKGDYSLCCSGQEFSFSMTFLPTLFDEDGDQLKRCSRRSNYCPLAWLLTDCNRLSRARGREHGGLVETICTISAGGVSSF